MGEIRTVTTLVKKRDEIRASIRMYEKKLDQAKPKALRSTWTPTGCLSGVSHGPSVKPLSPVARYRPENSP
jgi:hypothetical protein